MSVPMSVHILGVRHHSPACSHRVVWRMEQVRPAFVLIEGPADLNDRLAELSLPHTLPIAIYSYCSSETQHRGSWTPFTEHSPEWQALTLGQRMGATVRFMDLPAWHDAFADLENRYADTGDEQAEQRSSEYHHTLAEKMAVDNRDALWDHLFEARLSHPPTAAELQELDQTLDTYFEHLRAEDPGSLGNQAREHMMARWIAWAVAQNKGPVIVVCGGYHAPALARLWPGMPAEQPELPQPAPAETEIRHGSYLVPYTFKRLDAFTGYASGMPSPAYYQHLWKQGASTAGENMLKQITRRLRDKKQLLSTADLIGVHTRAYGLARLRKRLTPMRIDWLDALASAMVKGALDAPLPWTYRGTLVPGTDPVLVEAMDVMAGNEYGELAPGTPQPPLVHAIAVQLETLGIPRNGKLTLDLHTPEGRSKSQVLHQIKGLDIPGFQRQQGSGLPMGGEETWSLTTPFQQHSALVEAGAWGATLRDAARAHLEHQVQQAGNHMETLAAILNHAAFAGLNQISQKCLDALEQGMASAQELEPLGQVLASLHQLLRYGEMVHMADSPMLVRAVETAFDRSLWLFELPGQIQAQDSHRHILAIKALVQVCADVEAARRANPHIPYLAAIAPERARAVLQRKARHQDSAPLSRGCALGALLALGHENNGTEGAESIAQQALALLTSLAPAQLGDALAGMVALGREVLSHDPAFIQGLDQLVNQMDDGDFLLALPAMRGALSWLPSRERGEVAKAVLALYTAQNPLPGLSHHSLTAPLQAGQAEKLATNQVMEKQALALLARWGITLPPHDGTTGEAHTP